MIKYIYKALLLIICAVAMLSCENDDSVGVTVRPQDDIIIQGADTFHIASADIYENVMSAQADSMYLGEFYSPVFGTTKAELLVQLAPPQKYEFPNDSYNPQPDSLVLTMYYKSWYGARNIPLEISVYELNKGSIEFKEQYLSDLDINNYTDKSTLMGRKLVTSVDLSIPDSVKEVDGWIPSVRYKFDSTQLQRFYNIAKNPYDNINDFLDNFKGMYITSDYGASTVFNFFQIDLKLYYHYTYKKDGKDIKVNTSILYPANKEVRQLNKFSHNDLKDVVVPNDSINFIKASAGVYTKLSVPIGKIAKKIGNKICDKTLQISGADILIEPAEMEENTLDLSAPSHLMAISEDEYADFLNKYDVPTAVDTNAVIAYASSEGYKMDISYYLVKHLRNKIAGEVDENETLDLILLPVTLNQVADQNSGTVVTTRIRPQSEVGGVRIRSGKNPNSPMKMRVVYTGF